MSWRMTVVVAALAAIGCKKSTPPDPDGLSSPRATSQAPDPAEVERKKKEKLEELAKKQAAFLDSAKSSPASRASAYKEFVEAISWASDAIADKAAVEKFRPETAKKIIARLDEIERAETRDEQGAPDVPEKPEYNPPKYVPLFEKDELFDEADDRKAYQQELRTYLEDYKTKLAEYQKAIAENRVALADIKKRKAARHVERKQLEGQLDKILLALISSKGESAGPDVKLEPAKADIPRSPETATPQVSTTPKKKDRAACLRGCVASCSDDANCERACAAQKCN
ncbi:MAG: hypothetical protein AMXMBFR56_41220 [Polyangiaceae bacterium]